jgi:hypothetical protein
MAAGWDTPITPCLAYPPEGAMGYHYANLALMDDQVELLEPETLIYEPQRNGKLRLVGVEYIVPFTAVPADADPPQLLGMDFDANAAVGIWARHVWVWRHNPSGIFADWNPKVTCDWAP